MNWKIKSEVLNSTEIARSLQRVAHEILEKNKSIKDLVIVGIKTRGDYLASRIAAMIKKIEGVDLPLGAIDITLYRDDLSEVADMPLMKSTEIPFDVAGKKVVLVDDVLYTGRTARAGLDALIDLGRPSDIQLAVLIDRGHRQLPIQANYVGKIIQTKKKEIIKVNLKETDNCESVQILGE